VTNLNGDSVSVINPATNAVTATIPVGDSPVDIAFNQNNGNLYVTNFDGDTVYVITPLKTTFSSGCGGTIDAGQASVTCAITNTYGR
jgi:YVTN family beta-propeller protein